MKLNLQSCKLIDKNILRLYYSNGAFKDVFLSDDFGHIVERGKDVFFTSVTHTGIVLGFCSLTGQKLIIHNHPSTGANIVTISEFAQGNSVFYQTEPCSNTPLEVISIGLTAVLNQVPYQLFNSNCQILTNAACKDRPYSQDVNRIVGGICKGVIIYAGVRMFSNILDNRAKKKEKKRA